MNPSDKLTIETPEQIVLELPLAGIGSRSMAFAFDILLQFVAIIIIMAVLFFMFMALGPVLLQPGFAAIVIMIVPILTSVLLHLGYFIFFEIRWNGQTPGKRRFHLRVIKESGRPVTAMETIARNLLRPIDSLGAYAVGLICMILNKQHKRLGDYVAGTLVVYDKPPDRDGAIWNTGAVSPEAVSEPVSEPVKISPEELALVEAWLNRRYALTTEVRQETAYKIAWSIRKRTGIKPEDGQSVEDFLKSLARRARDTAGYRRQ